MKKTLNFIFIVFLISLFFCNTENKIKNEIVKKVENNEHLLYYKKAREHFLKFNINDVIIAIDYFEKSLQKKPDFLLSIAGYSEALSYFAFQKQRNGIISEEIYENAKKNALKALSINPNLLEANRALAWYYFSLSLYDKSKIYAEKALKINKEDPESSFIFWASFDRENLDSIYLKKALESGYILALINAGSLARRLKKYDLAINYFEEVIKIVPDHAHAFVNIGNVYLLKNNPEKALEYYNKAQKIYNNDSYIFFNNAAAYILLKDYKKAEEYYKKAIEINNYLLEAHEMLIKLYKEPLRNISLYNYHNDIVKKLKIEKEKKIKKIFQSEEN